MHQNVLICVNTASPVATGRETSRQLADKGLTAWQLPYLIFFNICSVCFLSFLNKGAKTDKLQNFQAGLLLQSLQWRCLVTQTVAAELKSPPRADLGPSLGQNGRRHWDHLPRRRFHLSQGWTGTRFNKPLLFSNNLKLSMYTRQWSALRADWVPPWVLAGCGGYGSGTTCHLHCTLNYVGGLL